MFAVILSLGAFVMSIGPDGAFLIKGIPIVYNLCVLWSVYKFMNKLRGKQRSITATASV